MSKKVGIIVGVVAVVALVIFVISFSILRKKTYRLLKVYEFTGEGSVTRDKKGDLTPYNNMVLKSGDKVKLVQGDMCLQADEDKFIYLEDDTELTLVATGNSENSKTTINLQKGAITKDIKNKLSNDSSDARRRENRGPCSQSRREAEARRVPNAIRRPRVS